MPPVELDEGGGSVSFDSLPLSGLHYVVVDMLNATGPGAITLDVACEETIVQFLSATDTCFAGGAIHRVGLVNLDANSVVNQQTLSTRDRIGFFYRQGEQDQPASSLLQWNPITGLEFNLAGDPFADEIAKCGYALDEPFIIKIVRTQDGFPVSFTVDAEYVFPDSLGTNAQGSFQPQGISAITRLTDGDIGEVSYLTTTVSYREVVQIGESFNSTVASNTSWRVVEGLDWISVTPTQGSNFDVITITASSNETTERRRGQILVIGDNGITKTITVDQPGFVFAPTAAPGYLHDVSLEVLPNPTTRYTTVRVEGRQIESIQVMDLLGRVVLHDDKRQWEQKQMDVGYLPSGLYTLRVNLRNGFSSTKMTKQ